MNEKIYLEILDSYAIGPSELIMLILQSPGYALTEDTAWNLNAQPGAGSLSTDT